uniref:Uncharacterized protein n=1 Tax=Sphaerodactylus townsendi TaxID=933632 RepID=A0ACB8GA96_9SAUR
MCEEGRQHAGPPAVSRLSFMDSLEEVDSCCLTKPLRQPPAHFDMRLGACCEGAEAVEWVEPGGRSNTATNHLPLLGPGGGGQEVDGGGVLLFLSLGSLDNEVGDEEEYDEGGLGVDASEDGGSKAGHSSHSSPSYIPLRAPA